MKVQLKLVILFLAILVIFIMYFIGMPPQKVSLFMETGYIAPDKGLF